MIIGKVVGEVVATTKSQGLVSKKILIVQQLDAVKKEPLKNQIVCVDAVGAGRGDIVVVSCGSSGRSVFENQIVPSDAVVVAIIDSIQTQGSD